MSALVIFIPLTLVLIFISILLWRASYLEKKGLMPDESLWYDENGNHIAYDRKYIRYLKEKPARDRLKRIKELKKTKNGKTM